MKIKTLILIIIVCQVIGCSKLEKDNNDSSLSLVVEGWIESEGFPVVMVTFPFNVTNDYQEKSSLSKYLVRWAKVSVCCEKDTIILTGKYDSDYFPPFIYTTTKLKGEPGKSYDLKVEYHDLEVKATTTIPHPVSDLTIKAKPCEGNDSLYLLTAHFSDNASTKDYYQFFTLVGTKSSQYLASYLGAVDDKMLQTGNKVEIPVYRGHQMNDSDYTPYFSKGDSVSIKLAHIDESSFNFWDSFTKEISLSGNMFLSKSHNIPTNIEGGYGYWCGYGVTLRHLIIANDEYSQ